MSETPFVAVITTIQRPTSCVRRLADALAARRAPLIVIGDRKGPDQFDVPGGEFYPLAVQERLPYRLSKLLPTGSYARKNLGYLLALEQRAGCLYETDDDNEPNETWTPRSRTTQARPVAPRPWMNVYAAFSDQIIWPRGLPLEQINSSAGHAVDPAAPIVSTAAPIQQGLADLAPDVDAIWRLVFGKDFYFQRGASLLLPPFTWCPFNSQSTWWWPEAYPLLYLPVHCSFRMTDIWRSFIAQRCLWELGHGMVFHGPEVVQQRNEHRLLADFRDEVPGYLQNQKLVDTLQALKLEPGEDAVMSNLARCYEALIETGIFPAEERTLISAWREDFEQLSRGRVRKAG